MVSLIHFSSTARKSFDGIISAAGSTLDYYELITVEVLETKALRPLQRGAWAKLAVEELHNVMDGDDEEDGYDYDSMRESSKLGRESSKLDDGPRSPGMTRSASNSASTVEGSTPSRKRKKNESLKKRLKRLLTGKSGRDGKRPKGAGKVAKTCFVQLSEDGTTLRWGWHQFIDLGTLHAIRRVDPSGASDPDAGTLKLWSGSVVDGCKEATLTFKSAEACGVWGHGLYTLLRDRVEDVNQAPPTAAMLSYMKRVFATSASSPKATTLTLEQARVGLAALGQCVSPAILAMLVQQTCPFSPPRDALNLTRAEFCRLVWHVKVRSSASMCMPKLSHGFLPPTALSPWSPSRTSGATPNLAWPTRSARRSNPRRA